MKIAEKKFQKRKFALVVLVTMMFLAAYAHHKYASKPVITGKLQDKEMNEISGIAASAVNKGVLYVHNDSGDTSRFFAIDETGKLNATYYFHGLEGAPYGVRDCEDIAVGPGPLKGKSYIYVGDIGDNGAVRNHIAVYRIAEPNGVATGSKTVASTPVYLKYPDGPRDAETLMIDPLEKLIYIVSKRQDSVTVYTAPLAFKTSDTITLTKRCKLFFAGFRPLKWITAGDISADGKQILLKSYMNIYYWKREPGVPVWKVMMQKPEELNYEQEKQGEAIGFTRDGKSFYTTSEGVFSPIYKYVL